MQPKRKKVIVTGTGLLASNIALYKKDQWEIIFLSRSETCLYKGTSTIQVDLLNYDKTENLLLNNFPDLVIHTSGLANVDECEKDHEAAYLANVVITKNLAIICSKLNLKLVHISTDHFANQNMDYSTENDIGFPLNVYAETKLMGDILVNRYAPHALILRTNFFGWGNGRKISFSDFIINNLRSNKTITLFDDVYYSPLFVNEVTDCAEELVNKNYVGLFNVVSNKKISKYEFGNTLANIFNLNKDLIIKGSIDRTPLTKRPHNMALCNNKLVKNIGDKFNFQYTTSILKLKNTEKNKE